MVQKENKIKFSDDYEKLPLNWKDTTATLLSVVMVENMGDMRKKIPAFFDYDCKFRNKHGWYQFYFKVGIILIFLHHTSGAPFTTLRRHTLDKYLWYQSKVGQDFVLTESEAFGNG